MLPIRTYRSLCQPRFGSCILLPVAFASANCCTEGQKVDTRGAVSKSVHIGEMKRRGRPPKVKSSAQRNAVDGAQAKEKPTQPLQKCKTETPGNLKATLTISSSTSSSSTTSMTSASASASQLEFCNLCRKNVQLHPNPQTRRRNHVKTKKAQKSSKNLTMHYL